ncbi:MAG: hypothetical protein U0599_20410 [Vicinamibacteria bacterium]
MVLALAAAALTTVAFLTSPGVVDGQDWLQMHAAYRVYAARALAAGRLPLWNPYVGLGRPFLADIETAVFYPPNLAFLLLSPELALALVLAGHVALALFGSVRLARSLGATPAAAAVAAVAFVAGAPFAAQVSFGQVGYSEGLAYVPLLFFLAGRLQDAPSARRAAALALALAMQLLCGHPQAAWTSWIGLAAFLAGRGLPRPRAVAVGLGGLASALALAFALAAPALLPTLELARQSARATPSLGFAATASMEWWQWSSLAVPDGGRHVFYWTFHLYAGVLALVAGLAGLSRLREPGVRGLAAAALVGAVVAAGTRTPLFAVLFHVVPGLSAFRIHARATLLPCLALVFAQARFLSIRCPARRAAAVLAPAAALALLAVAWSARALPPAPSRPALVQAALVVLAAGLGGAVVSARPAIARAAGLALPAIVLADVLTAHDAARKAWAAPPPAFLRTEHLLAEDLVRSGLAPAAAPPRVLLPPEIARENAALLGGWSSATGYNSLTLGRTWRYLHDRLGIDSRDGENTFVPADVYERGPFALREASISVGWDPAARAAAFRRDADPRVYLAARARRVADASAAARLMAAGHDVHAEALVEEDGPLPATSTAGPAAFAGAARVTSFEPERVVVRAETDRPALLVLKEAWYPGWSATVDGAPRPCVPANGWMRAVPLEPGSHEVVMTYRSRRLAEGLVAFAFAAAATSAMLARRPRPARDRLPLPR